MRKALLILGACAVFGAGAFWWATAPALQVDLGSESVIGNPQAGQLVFAAGGCASCHAGPQAKGPKAASLSGGLAFPSDFGTFYAPNISSDTQQGIGGWTLGQFANALTQGVSPQGTHYYPAFPYAAYRHMTQRDVADLFAFMQTLPSDTTPSKAHEVGFPFNIRRGLGLWKRLYVADDYVVMGELSAEVQRGRYLVEGLAHCGECHTPRGALGGLDRGAWLSGAPDPSGKGTIPGITPAKLGWSKAELVEYLTTGFTPDYDSAGGKMAEVVENLAQLPDSDRAAIAAYLVALP